MWLMSRRFLLCFLGLLTFLSVTSGLTVVLRQTATIPCNRSCSAVEWFRKEIRSLNPVCSFREGNFSVAPEFKDRIEFSEASLRQGNASLTIDNIVYNDRSWYVCSCDGEKVCDHFLEVLVPTLLEMVVGTKATLPCHADTDKRTAESNAGVRWEKDAKLVVKLEHGEMKFGAGFQDRVSVSKEDYNRGDLSLTIDDVKHSDAGLYRCFAANEKPTCPAVVALNVTDSPPCWSAEHYLPVVCVVTVPIAVAFLYVYRRKVLEAFCSRNILPQSAQED